MSNETKKALLNEHTTRRFWRLAGLRPINEDSYVFEEEEELEELAGGMKGMKGIKYADEDEPMDDEPMDDEPMDDEPVDDMGDLPAGGDEPMDDEPMDAEPGGDMEDVEVDVPEGDVASLKTARDILDQILAAVEGGEEGEGEEMDDMEMDEEEPPALEEESETIEEEDDAETLEEEEEPFELSEDNLNEAVERIASRIANRIYKTLKK